VPLKQRVLVRTQGNPFFVEESVQSLIETGGVVGEPGAYRLGTPSQTLQVPTTVQAVLAARIDRLPPEAKHLLQTAAVIGTEVPLPLLQAVAELDEERLHRGLAQLQAAEFLYETWRLPEPAYTFKHALTQEVAYGSLVQSRRRALHAPIVEALEGLAGDRLDDQVERLANHALRGEVWQKAFYRRWRINISASLTRPRAIIGGRSTALGRPRRSSTVRGAASASVRLFCPPCSPGPFLPSAMPSWAHSLRAVPSGKKGSGWPRRFITQQASWRPFG
jgi:hypothetical protein